MPEDIVESRPVRSILLGLALALGAIAASALLSRLRARMADHPRDDNRSYLGWVASVLNEERRARNAAKPTIH